MSVSGRSALVTGGASGIGHASAIALAREGAAVAVVDRNAQAAAEVAESIRAGGGRATALALDVSDSAAVRDVVARVREDFGRIDALVHCAGICPRRPLLEMSDEEWRNVLAVNLDGTFYIAREVGRVMVEQEAGTMILLTSDRGVHGSADYAHYAASKGGMIALTKSLALNLGQHGVTVNGVNPGMTDTPLARGAIAAWDEKKSYDTLGTFSLPEEIAELVLFLAGTGGAFMTGQIISARMRKTA